MQRRSSDVTKDGDYPSVMQYRPAFRSNREQIVGTFAHPVTLLCLGAWILNDQILKSAFGNTVTGKLSDVFGLVVFPLIITALLPRLLPRRVDCALVATAIFFTAINRSLRANSATLALLDVFLPNPQLTPDPTDLVALPALVLARWLWRNPVPVPTTTARRIGVMALAASVVATMATSPNDTIHSDRLIARVELLDDGRFAALHHTSITLGPSQYGNPEEVFDPLGDLRLGSLGVVYTSANGTDWRLDPTIDSPSIEWAVEHSGCIGDTCIDFEPALLGDGTITDVDGQAIFRLIEPAPSCHDGLASRLSPLGGDECLNNSAPGPVDITLNADSTIAVVALGTQGVAVFDGDDWKQVAIDTPGPRRWFYRHLRTLIWVALVAVLWFFALLGVVAYLRRYREPILVESSEEFPENDETPD